MHSAAEPLEATRGEPPLALLTGEVLDEIRAEELLSHDRSRLAPLALASGSSACYPKTRIGLFDFSEPTRTEPFPYATRSSHRACGPWWPEVTSDTRFFLSQDTYRGSEASPPSTHTYVYTLNNPVKYTDPSGGNAETKMYAAYGGDADILSFWILSGFELFTLAVLLRVTWQVIRPLLVAALEGAAVAVAALVAALNSLAFAAYEFIVGSLTWGLAWLEKISRLNAESVIAAGKLWAGNAASLWDSGEGAVEGLSEAVIYVYARCNGWSSPPGDYYLGFQGAARCVTVWMLLYAWYSYNKVP